jgi:hypothetical protein
MKNRKMDKRNSGTIFISSGRRVFIFVIVDRFSGRDRTAQSLRTIKGKQPDTLMRVFRHRQVGMLGACNNFLANETGGYDQSVQDDFVDE